MADAKTDPAPEQAALVATDDALVIKPAQEAELENTVKEAEPVATNTNEPTDANDEEEGQRRPRKDYSKNVKSDFSVQEESNDPAAIRKQVEFYFSEANILGDKFLYSEIDGPENRPIDIKLIHSFKRMRRFQPYSAVVEALKDSKLLEVIDDKQIKRRTPIANGKSGKTREELQKEFEDEALERSVYVKGFGEEQATTTIDIEEWFSQFGRTNQVRLRRAADRTFKGSVFTEFDSVETQKKFLELDPKPKFEDNDMKIMGKKEYLEENSERLTNGSSRNENGNSRGAFRGRGRGGRGNRGGRGRGRGGRDRDDRRRDRNVEREANGKAEQNNAEAAVTTEAPAEKSAGTKRPREAEVGDSGQPESKKVDTKTE